MPPKHPLTAYPTSTPRHQTPQAANMGELPAGVTAAPPPRTAALPPRAPASKAAGTKRPAAGSSGGAAAEGGAEAPKTGRQKHNEAVRRDGKAAEVSMWMWVDGGALYVWGAWVGLGWVGFRSSCFQG